MLAKEELLLIGYFIAVIALLTAFVIIFLITYQKRKNNLLKERYEVEKRFEQEIARSRLEIQEQTLKNVGWELHDNIGQLLSVANMQLAMLARSVEENSQSSVKEVKEVVANSLREVRSLSKSLNNEVIGYAGLEISVKNELSRFERLNVITTSFTVFGEKTEIPQKDAIVLFRIVQEFFSNVLKHAQAEKLTVSFKYESEFLLIEIADNGVGFDIAEVEKNSGLLNMQSRTEIIGANLDLTSSPGKGTFLFLHYPIKVRTL